MVNFSDLIINKDNYKCLTCRFCFLSCKSPCLKSTCKNFESNYINHDKKITVVLNTYRRDDVSLSESIYSAIHQSYKGYLFYIINTHPVPIKLDKGYDNVLIFNMSDDFKTYPRQAIWSVSRVTTPFFAILDDDDLLLTEYLADMSKYFEQKKYNYSRIVGKKIKVDSISGRKIKVENCGGWGGQVMPRISQKDFYIFFEKRGRKVSTLRGIDNIICNSVFTGGKVSANISPGYIMRRFNNHFRTSLKLPVTEYFSKIQDYKSKIYGEHRDIFLSPVKFNLTGVNRNAH